MSLLYFLEDLRNPFFDVFFSAVTHFGEEMLFIVLGIVFFWCVDKKQGYYLLSIGFIGTILNQFLKLLFRIPRPWVKDKNFTIVESARAEATGYSFPSGHTQASVGLFGGLARLNKQRVIRIISIVLCFLVPLSRMYLGVHTPLDVGVSIIIALILVFGLYPLISKCFENIKVMRILLVSIVLLSVSFVAFASFYKFPSDIDSENLLNGIENSYKMLGCTVGILVAFEIDRKFINFDTKAPIMAQFLKFFCGIIPLLGLMFGLKAPLNFIFGGHCIAYFIRYFIIVIFAGCIWPLTFKKFAGMFGNHKE